MTAGFAIDARMYRSGIGVYVRHLVQHAHDSFGWPMHVITRRDQARLLSPFCDRMSFVAAPIYSLREQFAVARAARTDSVLHVPHYNIPLLYGGIILATIHDLTHVLNRDYRKGWKSRLYGSPMLAACARRCSHIFTVSQYSKTQIIEHLHIPPERITVVYNGVGTEFFPGDIELSREVIRRRFAINRRFLLYVGNLKPHKNVEALLQAYYRLNKKAPGQFELVLISNDRSGEAAIQACAERLKITPRLVVDATTEEVAHCYRAAEVLVLPSFEEGFGLPVLEAMACGTPVICSNRSALPEVAGDAALFFEPDEQEHLSQVLEGLLSSPSLQSALRERGVERASRFTWRETARLHVARYSSFVG